MHGLRARCARAPRRPAGAPARNTTALTNSSTSPGTHSTARSLVTRPLADRSGRSAGDSTSPSCSRSLPTMPPPIAMYSNSFVGEPKNRLSTMWLLCGETKTSQAFEQPRAFLLRHAPDRLDAILQAVPRSPHRRRGACTSRRRSAGTRASAIRGRSRDRCGQHIDAVPAAERARETDHAIVPLKPSSLRRSRALRLATAGA